MQLLATDLLGMDAIAWTGDALPPEVRGMLRSRANTIEGGTTGDQQERGRRTRARLAARTGSVAMPGADPEARLMTPHWMRAGGRAMNSYETLVVERRGVVGWLEFNRPAAGNAMDAR